MIELPSDPGPQDAEPFFIDYSAQLIPPLGGEFQQVNRLGSRYGLSVKMPPLRDLERRQWVQRLLRGKVEGVRMEFPLLDSDPGVVGDPLVNGAGALGFSLNLKNCQAGYVFRENQYFSLYSGGKHYLHSVTSEVVVPATGLVTLTVFPALRKVPADNDPVHFRRPMIEGMIQGNELRWRMALTHDIEIGFEIREIA